ncbi:MAG TPA: ZIP family metal transporter [Leptospiraceae bacterium]|nr:ZIP family metal transporter [Leptospiraceae bacterium]HMX54973.1 ZIP family metal transporter [Leptospiraceae bacterium]HNJ03987.1 ZIP family metal transporter [Leptospiraceae bacterium]HNN57308.1 ZIP family metal transporter [Leptospiraceae bacterium]HNN73254.1 ZIP family metal transporter [Leptospiraceae bacterium]
MQQMDEPMGLAAIALILFLGSTGVTAFASGFLFLPAKTQKSLLPILVSFATGALLATALLVMIPDTLRQAGTQKTMQWVLIGILFFFLLERLVIFRHCHEDECSTHRAAGAVILTGDAIHSFFDGVIIASAFQYSVELGIATSISILIHEIPQEISDFAVLIQSGYTRNRALLMNYLAALPSVAGGILTFYFLSELRHLLPFFMSISAASLIYVAIADLVPGLHRYAGLRTGLFHFLFLLAGVGVIAWIRG